MIGERLKEQRIKCKARQQDLADAIGVQTSMISRYETNRDDPSDKIKVRIVQFLGVSLDYLLGVVDEPVSYYCKDRFIIMEDALTGEDKGLILEFLGYLRYRKEKNDE